MLTVSDHRRRILWQNGETKYMTTAVDSMLNMNQIAPINQMGLWEFSAMSLWMNESCKETAVWLCVSEDLIVHTMVNLYLNALLFLG